MIVKQDVTPQQLAQLLEFLEKESLGINLVRDRIGNYPIDGRTRRGLQIVRVMHMKQKHGGNVSLALEVLTKNPDGDWVPIDSWRRVEQILDIAPAA